MADLQNFIDFIDYVYDDHPYHYPARRYLRDADNPLEFYDDGEFTRRFRFRKDTVITVILPLLSLSPQINKRGLPIPPLLQLITALRFYATGSYQIVCGDLLKISQPVVCRIVSKISRALALKVGQFVKFPPSNELPNIKRDFYRRARFPGVIGCIDCTHVPIKNPSREQGEIFRNRKGTFSINVQLVCGPNMEIYDVVARWPGSVHDSRIFSNSRCCMRLEQGELQGLLLGDSGYAQTTYMYTPILNPETIPQRDYNRAQISTRNIIERVNGVWKRRFSCLARKLQHNINNIPNIIVACAVLHNISISYNEELPEPMHVQPFPQEIVPDNQRGSAIRAAFIQRHFS